MPAKAVVEAAEEESQPLEQTCLRLLLRHHLTEARLAGGVGGVAEAGTASPHALYKLRSLHGERIN